MKQHILWSRKIKLGCWQEKYVFWSLLSYPLNNKIIDFVENYGADEKFRCLVLLQRRLGSTDTPLASSSKALGPSWARNSSTMLGVSEVPLSTAATHRGYFKLEDDLSNCISEKWCNVRHIYFTFLLLQAPAIGSGIFITSEVCSEHLLSGSVFHI